MYKLKTNGSSRQEKVQLSKEPSHTAKAKTREGSRGEKVQDTSNSMKEPPNSAKPKASKRSREEKVQVHLNKESSHTAKSKASGSSRSEDVKVQLKKEPPYTAKSKGSESSRSRKLNIHLNKEASSTAKFKANESLRSEKVQVQNKEPSCAAESKASGSSRSEGDKVQLNKEPSHTAKSKAGDSSWSEKVQVHTNKEPPRPAKPKAVKAKIGPISYRPSCEKIVKKLSPAKKLTEKSKPRSHVDKHAVKSSGRTSHNFIAQDLAELKSSKSRKAEHPMKTYARTLTLSSKSKSCSGSGTPLVRHKSTCTQEPLTQVKSKPRPMCEKSPKQPLYEEDICTICMDAVINCVMLECGHMVTCIRCGQLMNNCPVCREKVERVKQIFKG